MRSLHDRVAIVTGASRGIGRAVARHLGAAGAAVVAGAREQHAESVVAEIREAGGRAVAVSVDVTDVARIEAMVRTARAEFGRIDVLVNNAGIVRDQLAMRMTPADWDAVVATNLTAAFACAHAVLRPMLKQRSGRIISVGSVVGQMGNAGQVNYAASKAGLVGFSKALAREVASRGITVNVVSPGMIETDMTAGLDDAAQAAMLAQIPLGRLGSTDDVAAAVEFLASDEAAYITGHVLAVNGGMYM
ncbi:MAG: 3-oxoacyl-[acyl-carrier-protein] reductase [Acidobacteria bacterium]|jgi:3-oxoacyl-[acyl-carrier protein] reductase|nr:3-oxoacyl-[acyl-carrier-protein] reductase [Acidobacteriota bacterium]MDP7479538.1 3-oxoacyl-[acyl-carrier-protein] reductase [Vicinamibacterales bacterium]HJN43678.1 3-oxoacyl-[acyl-carrier-protein] reductase [Vicinamibacterales bacterium]|tara:strand:+ start:439 stop:1179 length:741 start_codon:yes stop_codon:yes gene_type:complete